MIITDRASGQETGNCRDRISPNPIINDTIICFVSTPTTCKDQQPTQNFPGLISSESACDSGKH